MIYTVLQYRRGNLISNKSENEDKEKGTIQNNLDELFESTADDEGKFKDNVKRKSFPNEEDQRTAKVHGFFLRAMTLPQSVIQTVGKIQTIQITEPSVNLGKIPNKTTASNQQQQIIVSSTGSSPTSQSLINTTAQSAERPANLAKKPQSKAVKSPSSNYLKKSPSPTGQKSPPQTELNEKQETITITNDEIASTSKEQDLTSLESNLTNKESSDDQNGEFRLGKMQFCLKYNYEKHAITVSMIKCTNLPGKNTMNTYVKLQLLPDKKHKVSLIKA